MAIASDQRPDPDELLAQLREREQRAARGRLRIYFGASAGVGKTYAMLGAARREFQAGRDVVINGSREYVPQLLKLFPQAQVIWIDADANQLRERLHARQRESGAALLKRIERAAQFSPPDTQAIVCLQNNGPLEIAGRQLLDILQR